jgi:hypothetical protein
MIDADTNGSHDEREDTMTTKRLMKGLRSFAVFVMDSVESESRPV